MTRRAAILAYLALGSMALLALVLSVRTITETDLGFHLRAAEWAVDNGRPPDVDTFTYTVAGRRYVDSQWLFQLLLLGAWRLAGSAGLVALQAALILAAFGVAALAAWPRRRASAALALATVLLPGVLASEIRFNPRPELATWLLLAATLLLVQRRMHDQAAPLWVLALIQLLWVNLEGLWVLGPIAVACALLGRWLETRRFDRVLAAWAGAGVLVSLANPYGLDGLLFPLTLVTRLGRDNAFGQTISEFVSPWDFGFFTSTAFYPRAALWAYYALSAVTALAAAFTWRRRRAHEVLLAIVFFALSAQAIRNVPLFVLAALPLAAGAVADVLDGTRSQPAPQKRPRSKRAHSAMTPGRAWPLRPALAVLAAVLALGLAARVLTGAYYIDDRREARFGDELSSAALPVRAVEFMRANAIEGRVLNHLAYGGYLEWQLRRPVFADGRLEVMGDEFYARYRSAGTQLAQLLDTYDAQVAIFPYRGGAYVWLEQMRAAARWRLVYFDDASVIYLRDDANPALPAVSAPAATPGGVPIPVPGDRRTALLYAPRRTGLPAWLAGFWQPQAFPGPAQGLGVLFTYLEQWDPAEAYLLDALQAGGGRYYEVYANLAAIYYRAGRTREAIYCYQVLLADQPDNALARRRLSELGGAAP